MKRLISVVASMAVATVLTFSLSGCGDSKKTPPAEPVKTEPAAPAK